MSFSKANIAGLASARQQSEMKSILAGTWPPLKPLPVFKYETLAYRATIDFDKLRGEWVCRKTSLPSNNVQELRGGLREITMALSHGEAEMFVGDSEPQEEEVEKDTNRRLQAINDWKENSESGARYFELREALSESQRTELDNSLRLTLTARQLQFSAKNVAYVFDAISTAGGRFAALIEFAKSNKAKQQTAPSVRAEETASDAEPAIVHDNFSLELSFRESVAALNDNEPFVRGQQAAEHCADDFPALSIKNVLPEQASFLADRMERTSSQEIEIEASEIAGEDCESLVQQPQLEDLVSPTLSDFAAEARMAKSSADSSRRSSLRLPALEISAFQVAAFALLFLFSVAAFTMGLTVGRGPLGRRLLTASKAPSAIDVKSPTQPEQADESARQTPTSLLAGSAASSSTSQLDAATTTIESEDSAKSELTAEHVGEMTSPIVSNVSPPAIPNTAPSLKTGVPVSSAPGDPGSPESTAALRAIPHVSRPTILVNAPIGGSQPFRVSFPEAAIAATSSLAMTSQLSVLLSLERGPLEAYRPARLEAGKLVALVWPRYPQPGNLYGGAEVIRIRATIGQLGRVREVKFLSGSRSLLPATTRAIRQWRYTPTLLNKRPVQAQQDLTIEFRPPQSPAQLSTRRPSHK